MTSLHGLGVPGCFDNEQICFQTFEGYRNRPLIALLADSGLRISEALRLRIESVNFSLRTLDVRGGKGGKDPFNEQRKEPLTNP